MVDTRVDLVEACQLTLDAPADSFVTTVDLLYAVSQDPYTCGYVSVVHALSDVFAVLGTPAWATVSVGLSHRAVAAGQLGEIMRGASDALCANGAVFGGAHSVHSSEMFIGVAATGLANARYIPRTPEPGDVLVLTKPIGSGIALSALRMGLVAESDLAAEFFAMRESNRAASALLATLSAADDGGVRAVTDVSGFGFLHAAAVVSHGASVVIDGSVIRAASQTSHLMSLGAISPLTDKNMLATEALARFERVPASELASLRVLLNDPQTSGGLLVALSPESAQTFLRGAAGLAWLPVIAGTYPAAADVAPGPETIIVRAG